MRTWEGRIRAEDRQRRDPQDLSSRDAAPRDWWSSTCKAGQPASSVEPIPDGSEVLTVVQQQQALLAAKVEQDRMVAGRTPVRPRAATTSGRPVRIGEVGFRPRTSLSEMCGGVPRGRQREARLAHAAGTGQRQERNRVVKQQSARRHTLDLPADETGARNRDRTELKRCSRGTHAHSQPDTGWLMRDSVPDSG